MSIERFQESSNINKQTQAIKANMNTISSIALNNKSLIGKTDDKINAIKQKLHKIMTS
jgi:hypothetical protein